MASTGPKSRAKECIAPTINIIRGVVGIVGAVKDFVPYVGPVFTVIDGILGLIQVFEKEKEPNEIKLLQDIVTKIDSIGKELQVGFANAPMLVNLNGVYSRILSDLNSPKTIDSEDLMKEFNLFNTIMTEDLLTCESWISYLGAESGSRKQPAYDLTWGLEEALSRFLKAYYLQLKGMKVFQEKYDEQKVYELNGNTQKQWEQFGITFEKYFRNIPGEKKCITDLCKGSFGAISYEDAQFYWFVEQKGKRAKGKRAKGHPPQISKLQVYNFKEKKYVEQIEPRHVDNENIKGGVCITDGRLYYIDRSLREIWSYDIKTDQREFIYKRVKPVKPFQRRSQMVCLKNFLYVLSCRENLCVIDLERKSAVTEFAGPWSDFAAVGDAIYAIHKKTCRVSCLCASKIETIKCDTVGREAYETNVIEEGTSKIIELTKCKCGGLGACEIERFHMSFETTIWDEQFSDVKAVAGHGTHLYIVDGKKIKAIEVGNSSEIKTIEVKIPNKTDKTEVFTVRQKAKKVHLTSTKCSLCLQVKTRKHINLYLIKPFDLGKIYSSPSPKPENPQHETPVAGLMTPAKHHLKIIYDGKKYVNVNGFYGQHDIKFVNLNLFEKKEEKTNEKTNIQLNTLLSSKMSRILVEGKPGMGKSALSRELCKRWNPRHSSYKLVLHFELSNPHVRNATDLSNLLKTSLNDASGVVFGEADKLEKGKGLLLIFDGFDELPASYEHSSQHQGSQPTEQEVENSYIMKLIRGEVLQDATRLITSRPSGSHNIFPAMEYMHVHIDGFTDESKQIYIKQVFADSDRLATFSSMVESNKAVHSLMDIPIYCDIMAYVFEETGTIKGRTTTEVYDALVGCCIRKYMIEMNRWNEKTGIPSILNEKKKLRVEENSLSYSQEQPPKLPQDIMDDLEKICELAFKNLYNEKLEFKKFEVAAKPLGLLVVTNQFPFTDHRSGGKKINRRIGEKNNYSYSHQTVKEFLAAWYVTYSAPMNLFEEVKKKCKENRAQLFTFVCFLAGMNGFIDGIIISQESNDFCEDEILTLLYYIYESQNSEEAKKFGKILSKHSYKSPFHPYLYRIQNLEDAKILRKLLSSSSDSESPDSESEHTSPPSSFPDCIVQLLSSIYSSSSHDPTVVLSTPQDMYVFGYSLVHMSLEWSLQAMSWNLSFNPLVFSIKDHKQDGEIYGKIKDVKVWTLDWSFKAINSLVPITGITIFQGFYHSSIHVLAQMPPEELSNLKYLNFVMHTSCNDKCLPSSISTVADIAYKTSIINYFLCSNECLFNIIDSFYLRIQDCITLSHALRHPDISLLNLKRAKSLHDLTARKVEDESVAIAFNEGVSDHHKLDRCHSCPDLLEVQSLSNMNCKLKKAIDIMMELEWIYQKYYFDDTFHSNSD